MSYLSNKNLKYFENGKVEIEKFWKRLNTIPNFKNKTILDFGCGHGALCIDAAQKLAKKVVGIDLENQLIEFAKENLLVNHKQFNNVIEFKKISILKKKFDQKFDVILSKDTFEHTLDLDKIIIKFYEILNSGGIVYLGFGPLYNAFNGDHGFTQLKFPWLHALLPENFIIKFYNKKNDKKIKSIEDLGLNKYTLKQYKNLFKKSKFEILYFKTNLSDHPFSIVFDLFKNVPVLKEYFTNNIYCILKKNN